MPLRWLPPVRQLTLTGTTGTRYKLYLIILIVSSLSGRPNHTIKREKKYDLANTAYKYKTNYRGKISNINNVVGDQYLVALTGRIP